MGYSNPDVYYQPEAFGLVIVGEINDPEASYSFDDLVVWYHPETNKVYWASDSGCSCPSPFEMYTSIDNLNEVTSENWFEFERTVIEHCNPQYLWRYLTDEERAAAKDPQAADKVDLLRKVSDLLG